MEDPEQRRSARYLVEIARPDCGWGDIQGLATRARQSCEALRREGSDVRFMRVIFVPEDETCLFLYEADSEDAIRESATRASLALERFVETIPFGPAS
jgi:hypothetical protein